MAKQVGIPVESSNKREHTLVMLSGGVDSTAALWHTLNHRYEYCKVHVHHIHIHNLEGRWKIEAQAVKAILKYMEKHAPIPFTYSESVIAVPSVGKNFLFDAEPISFITGYMTSRDPSITKVVIGATNDDFRRNTTSNAIKRGKAIHNAFHDEKNDHSGAIKNYPLKDLTKQAAYDLLPPELARLTWSCRTPLLANGSYIECGTCKACKLELRHLSRTRG